MKENNLRFKVKIQKELIVVSFFFFFFFVLCNILFHMMECSHIKILYTFLGDLLYFVFFI